MNYSMYNFEKLCELDIRDQVKIVEIDVNKYDTSSEEIINELIKCANIRELVLNTNNYDTYSVADVFLNFNNKIALLQNLSEIEIDFTDARYSISQCGSLENIKYTYENSLTYFYLKYPIDILPNIKYLNIISINKNNVDLLNYLPENIYNIHISCADYFCLDKIKNLPVTLKNMNITIITNNENLKIDDTIVKLPFACKLQIDYIVY